MAAKRPAPLSTETKSASASSSAALAPPSRAGRVMAQPRAVPRAGSVLNKFGHSAFIFNEKMASDTLVSPRPGTPKREERGENPLPPHTKVIATIGPASRDKATLRKLLGAGMNVARLNFSHGTHEYHAGTIANLRDVLAETRRVCGIMLDTKGAEIRTGMLKDGKEVELKKGQEFVMTTDTSVVGDTTRVAVDYANIVKVLKVGDSVLVDDGLLELRVEAIKGKELRCRVLNAGLLGQRKGVNLPGVVVDLPGVTEKDVEDIKFGVSQGVDFVAASFVRKPEDVMQVRETLGARGRGIKIISKIESREGVDNMDRILRVSDGVMVARGDLGVEIPLEEVALVQKAIIRKCNAAGKFVITATQMLESMVVNPSPTRAEASDVANAVFDGTDCVMLSGETAKGKYPVESVRMMADICREAESATDFRAAYKSVRQQSWPLSVPEGIASSAVKASLDLGASVIVVLTNSGTTARLVAKYRPAVLVLTITASEETARQCLVSKGLFPLLVGSMLGTESLVTRAIAAARNLGLCKGGDRVVVTTGSKEGVSGGTNSLNIQEVPP